MPQHPLACGTPTCHEDDAVEVLGKWMSRRDLDRSRTLQRRKLEAAGLVVGEEPLHRSVTEPALAVVEYKGRGCHRCRLIAEARDGVALAIRLDTF